MDEGTTVFTTSHWQATMATRFRATGVIIPLILRVKQQLTNRECKVSGVVLTVRFPDSLRCNILRPLDDPWGT
jgi:hypothetical protein